MTDKSYDIPESWLSQMGGYDASGWLTAFVQSPKKAVSNLLWNSFYYGPLNIIERGQLLEGWLDRLGKNEQFAERLDLALAGWIDENWGRFNQSAEVLVSAWSCLCGVVEFSSKLSKESHLKNSAAALKKRFTERQRFLGSFSTAPAADPLGLYLAVIAEFQGEDRSLSPFWHCLCDLPDNVPFYHARYAILGLRRLRAADPSENGTLRAEVVFGLLQLLRAFDRLVREGVLPEYVAQTTFRRVAAQTAAAYPNSPRWREHGLANKLKFTDRAKRWLKESVPPLAETMRSEENKKPQRSNHAHRSIESDPDWKTRAQKLLDRLKKGDRKCLSSVNQLMKEERLYAENTGDTFSIVRSLCYFSKCVLPFHSSLALNWAVEAREWEPHNAYTWTTIKNVLLKQQDTSRALNFAWIIFKRFPNVIVAHTGLAEVLKKAGRYDEAERVNHATIEQFKDNPDVIFAYIGQAEVFKATNRDSEAEQVFRDTLYRFKDHKKIIFAHNSLADIFFNRNDFIGAETEYRNSIKTGIANEATFVGLAWLVLLKGQENRSEAFDLINQALKLDPFNVYSQRLRTIIDTKNQENFNLNDVLMKFKQELEILYDAHISLSIRKEAVPLLTSDQQTDILGTTNEVDQISDMESNYFASSDSFKFEALIAEANFYRTWAIGAEESIARLRRQKAVNLLDQAEKLVPQDAQVLAERAALMADEGNKLGALENLSTHLGSHPAAAPLLVLKARFDREKAREEKRRMNTSTFSELCIFPQRLVDRNPVLLPLFHFEKGLAALALLDGELRINKAAEFLSKFRQTLARRATEEQTDRKKQSQFHEWLQLQTERHFFAALPEKEKVRPDDIPSLDSIFTERRSEVHEIEDMFVDRLVFGMV